jgi:predicted metal-dependent HD superfamily phosphohydrolase
MPISIARSNFGTSNMTKAKQYWVQLMKELAVAPAVNRRWWQRLSQLYGAKDRHYHRLKHITHLLDALTEFGNTDPALVIAAFFHDAIYDAESKENEVRSAALALQFIAEACPSEQLTCTVNALIMATQKHSIVDGVESDIQKLFLDCDLLILGATPKFYDIYTRNIRQEYKNFNDADYAAGRRGAMEKFLQRERLFFTDPVRDKYEVRARANIRCELNKLQSLDKLTATSI